MTEPKITVLIADDHPIFLRGLRQIIETDDRFKVVASVGDGEVALTNLRALRPHVAVLDVDMPARNGLAVLNAVREEKLPTSIVLLTMHKDERYLNAALDAGAKGYVIKDSAVTEITDAISTAARAENFISPMLSTMMVNRLNRTEKTIRSSIDSLTRSERRVLRLVAESKSCRQIADELFISVRTAENHRSNICAKLNLEGRDALLTFALTHKSEI